MGRRRVSTGSSYVYWFCPTCHTVDRQWMARIVGSMDLVKNFQSRAQELLIASGWLELLGPWTWLNTFRAELRSCVKVEAAVLGSLP